MIERSIREAIGRFFTYILLVGTGLAAAGIAQASVQPSAVSSHTFTPRRLAGSLSVIVALTGAVIGGRALARAAGRLGAHQARSGALRAMVLGPVGLIGGALVVATAKGGVGTGNGVAGGVLAVMVGFIGLALGGLALARSRRVS